MNVRRYWDLQIAADGGKNLTAFAYANSAKRTHGTSIRLVVRRLENEMNIFGGADLADLLRHAPDKFFGLNYARSQNESATFTANGDFLDSDVLSVHLSRSFSRRGRLSSITLP